MRKFELFWKINELRLKKKFGLVLSKLLKFTSKQILVGEFNLVGEINSSYGWTFDIYLTWLDLVRLDHIFN